MRKKMKKYRRNRKRISNPFAGELTYNYNKKFIKGEYWEPSKKAKK